MHQLNVETHIGLKKSLQLNTEVALFICKNGFALSATPRNSVLKRFDHCANLPKAPDLSEVGKFLKDILKDSNSEFFTIQIEAIPAKPKLNPIFNSIETLPEEDRSLILVFTDKEIMSGVMYCKEHDEFHTRKGDVKKHLIHQWAYADEFYAQLNLPEFPKEQPKRSGLDEAIPELFKLLFAAAAMAEKASDQEKKKGFKFH